MRRPGLAVALALSLALLMGTGCPAAPPVSTIVVEEASPAVRGGELVELVGVAVEEGRFEPVLEPPCALPCEVPATFSTEFDDQPEIAIMLYRGATPVAAHAKYLGTFLVTGLEPAAAGEPTVLVTFHADSTGLSLSAVETSGVPVVLERAKR